MNEPVDRLLDEVRATLRRWDMLDENECILAAVSGGADSVCLAHVLGALDIPFAIAHFDHQTREGASAEDAEFVKHLAAELGVPFYVASQPVADDAAASGLSFETYAREQRYAFLSRIAVEESYSVIATGHHRDDVAETVLLRLLRGASPEGLAGIPPVRLVATDAGTVRIVRPLIGCSREAIEVWLHERKLPYRTDVTNRDPVYLRNRIRHELIPQLSAEYNPRLTEALYRTASLLRDEHDFMAEQTQRFLERCMDADGHLIRDNFREGPRALQRRALRFFTWEHGAAPDFDRVEAGIAFICHGPTGHVCDLGDGLALRNARERTEVVEPSTAEDMPVIPLAMPGITKAFGSSIRIRYRDTPPSEPLSVHCSPTRQVFDADRIDGPLAIRHRQPGDRFRPLGMTGRRKLKNYFIDLGLPHSVRRKQLLLVDRSRILWVISRAMAADAAVTADTRRWLEVTIEDATEIGE